MSLEYSNECGGGNVYIAYARFAGAPVGNSAIYFSRSTNCGKTYSKPAKLSGNYNMTQRVVIALDPRPGTPTTTGGGTLYAVFRAFQPDEFVFARSTDYGTTWTSPAPISNRSGGVLCTYDQPTTGIQDAGPDEQTARAMSFASAQVDSDGKLHVVWAERVALNGSVFSSKACSAAGATYQPKIVYTSSTDKGKTWITRRAIDIGPRCETQATAAHGAGMDRAPSTGGACPANTDERPAGPQIQPSLVHSAGTLMVLYN